MALNVGDRFKQRWLAAPEAVRQTFIDELEHICDLLDPDTHIQKWQYQDALIQQKHQQVIKQAYHKLKLEILAEQARIEEERKRQRQAALEQALEDKRAQDRAEIERLEQLEQLKAKAQLDYLQQYAHTLQQCAARAADNTVKFDVTQAKQFNADLTTTPAPSSLELKTPYAEDLRTRLELEAEFYIEQTLQQLRLKLQTAAREEIELALLQHQEAEQRSSDSE